MSCLLCALFFPAMICYFGTFASDRIENVADITYDTNWYEYPEEARKHIILIVARAQEPVFFMGFGVVRATLEVFGKVCFKFVNLFVLLNSPFEYDSFHLTLIYSYFDHPAHTT